MPNRPRIMLLTLFLAVFTVATPSRTQETSPEAVESAAELDFQVVIDPNSDKVKYEGTTSQAEIGDLVRFTVEESDAASFKWIFLGDPAQSEKRALDGVFIK